MTNARVLVSAVLIPLVQLTAAPAGAQPAQQPLLSVDAPMQSLVLERCVPLRPRVLFGWSARLSCEPPRPMGAFSVRVFDKNRAGALTGLRARLDTISKSPGGFDPNQSLSFTVNGSAVDLWGGPVPSSVAIQPNTQANVVGSLSNLQSGEYNVTFRFVSSSSPDNDAERVTLAILVKDEPWMPIVVILLGVGVAFLTKKVFVAAKDRLAVLARISQLDTPWLRNEPPSSAVVWAQANLRLAKAWTRQAWLNVPDIVPARLADIEALVPTLKAIRDMRAALELNVSDELALARSLGKLLVLTGRCGNPPLPAADKQQISDELTAIGAWARTDQVGAALWKDRLPSIGALVASANPAQVSSQAASAIVTALIADLKAALALPNAPPNVFTIYEEFAALEVFWQHRTDTALLDTMAADYTKSQSVKRLLKISDDDSWAKLKAVPTITIVAPTVPQQAYDPFVLRVETSDDAVNDSYLFRYKLRYRWKITITGKKRTVELTPETLEPSVAQYAPFPGSVSATVTIVYGATDSLPVTKPATLTIEKSDALPLVGAIERAEAGPLILAALLACVAGLSTQYFGNTTFGSPKDYLTLFLTGAAFDWAKNAVQNR